MCGSADIPRANITVKNGLYFLFESLIASWVVFVQGSTNKSLVRFAYVEIEQALIVFFPVLITGAQTQVNWMCSDKLVGCAGCITFVTGPLVFFGCTLHSGRNRIELNIFITAQQIVFCIN